MCESIYKNIKIKALPGCKEAVMCEQVIDLLKVNNYALYEVVLTIEVMNVRGVKVIMYTTCLQENANHLFQLELSDYLIKNNHA